MHPSVLCKIHYDFWKPLLLFHRFDRDCARDWAIATRYPLHEPRTSRYQTGALHVGLSSCRRQKRHSMAPDSCRSSGRSWLLTAAAHGPRSDVTDTDCRTGPSHAPTDDCRLQTGADRQAWDRGCPLWRRAVSRAVSSDRYRTPSGTSSVSRHQLSVRR